VDEVTNQQQQKPQLKKPYKQPKFTTYGDLRTLTQSGSKPGLENQGNVDGNNSNIKP
jgi:hypothetical protein